MWNQERDAELNAFLDTDPRLSDFEEKFHFYQELEERFLAEPDCIVIGPIAVYTGSMEKVHIHVYRPMSFSQSVRFVYIVSKPLTLRRLLIT